MPQLESPHEVYLLPGEHHVDDARCRMRTMLGSCVSITLWHAEQRVGAMSHFLLPTRLGQRPPVAFDGRYGDEALWLLIRGLAQWGVDARECQAKVFGGGHMFGQAPSGRWPPVGQRNGEWARALLKRHGIEVVAESLFGAGHRQIIFEVASGDVWARQINPTLSRTAPTHFVPSSDGVI